jgi:hypothetical protein
MSLKEQFSQDAASCFLNSDEFAENITYTPKGESPRVIKAVVNRKRIDPAYEVASINKGGDLVSLAEFIGGALIDWVVADILDQDEGVWHLLLQK